MSENGSHWRGDKEEEEEEEELDETGYKSVKDAVLFAIDVSASMLEEPPQSDSKKADHDSATSAALKCAYALMQQRIISNPKDMMGILLFGTKQSRFQQEEYGSNDSQYPHCYLLSDLDIPAASDVKRLRSMIEDEDESKKLLVPSKESVAMANVLFCANQIFTTKAPNFSSRRLFLVTDNDSPHAKSKDLRSSAIVRAKDLYDLGVIIELFPISKADHDFETSKFYDDIVYRENLTDTEAPAPVARATKASEQGNGISLLNSLLNSINSKPVPRRAYFSNRVLEFSPNFRISVKGFIIFKKQVPARSCYIWLEGETPQLAVGKTTIMADDTARTVEKGELRKAFKFGGENVTFTPEELASIKNFGDPIIRILGFKPLSMLPLWANMRPATFIYPSEEEFIGSTRVFSALHQSLVDKQKMAVVYYVARKNATPVLAALLPGKERLGEHGEQLVPAGLWISPLPFADDIRSNPEMTTVMQAPDILIDKMRIITQQLHLPKANYDPARYPNPALQWHYRILQAMALDEDLPEKPEDKTVPKYRQIDKRAGPYVVDWGISLEEEYKKWQRDHIVKHDDGNHAGDKRPASKASSSSAAKKIKTEAGKEDVMTDAEMKKCFKSNTVSRLTIPKLKSWLQEKGEKNMSTMKKPDLVSLVEQHFESKMDLD